MVGHGPKTIILYCIVRMQNGTRIPFYLTELAFVCVPMSDFLCIDCTVIKILLSIRHTVVKLMLSWWVWATTFELSKQVHLIRLSVGNCIPKAGKTLFWSVQITACGWTLIEVVNYSVCQMCSNWLQNSQHHGRLRSKGCPQVGMFWPVILYESEKTTKLELLKKCKYSSINQGSLNVSDRSKWSQSNCTSRKAHIVL